MADESNVTSIVLFGRTGSGKSTMGNMLLFGHPNPEGQVGFPVGDGVRGVSLQVAVKGGRGWLVTDTIGLGEPELGAVSNELAAKRLCEFLEKLKQGYRYIVYVAKKERMQDSHVLTWELFKKIFEGGETNFVVVFTNTSQEWVDSNIGDIRKGYQGCDRFIGVDFPPVSDNEQREALNISDRKKSLEHFETKLAGYNLGVVYPKVARLTGRELLEHAKLMIADLVKFAAQNFIMSRDNPLSWVIQKLTGFFY